MGLFNFSKAPEINAGLKEFEAAKGAVLLDVRTAQEYAQGRIPKSQNIPLQELSRAGGVIADRNTPIFVYCLSGARSKQAVSMLKNMGYTDVTNIGGISGYRGKVE